ncbi:EAL and HDOD domain-containing protein [Paraburkholderia guartelaensis]|uniref:EAL and HDOD domain-containing protein n=1 Tax=Paraburkholderia guartelaensis TaxID=2546446 RepID=UPI002AB69804|nr:EAL domain-containing protein [Paraburkholderia guartelaensis]
MAEQDVQRNGHLADVIHPTRSPVADIYLGRQPILDRGGALAGYELLFRCSRTGTANVADADEASAQVLENTLGSFGMSAILNGHPGYINVGAGLLMSNALEAVPTDGFVLEILEDVEFDDAVIARCYALHAAGYRLALDDVSPHRPVPDAVLGAIEIVKIELTCTPAAQLPALVGRFTRAGKTVLAEKVETREDFEHAAMLGCELFQGYFFARPEVLASRKSCGSRAPLLRLLTVLNAEPDLQELEETLKANPDIVLQVFRLANAAGSGARESVRTLREAIGRVGTTQLTRWVQLLLYAQGSDVPLRANALVQLVGTRARFMELTAHRIASRQTSCEDLAANAYLTGMLSLAHVALKMDGAELLEQLRIGTIIRGAIERHEGQLGGLLTCAVAAETHDEPALDAVACRWPVLDRATIAELGISAAQWVAQQCG